MITVNEIFQELANHMQKGVKIHQELMYYYDFLNLCKYKKCHKHHYLEENQGYRKLYHYYIKHYNKLIEIQPVQKLDIIPCLWYRHKQEDVDTQMKRRAVEAGMKIWIDWEKETKELYQQKFQELMQIGQIAAAMFLKQYVCDVDKQLKYAESKNLTLQAANYDILFILEEQER